ncbi:sexual differentiation process protein [Lophiotrema nucula]|uniref:Sexual differentiation process protein n=1 Tax=Lophiotrema nucula TaxID=690887 RepID=A0A6A5Z221_9PLEO|nr:sexual differentiation process protein [Lophiotrema nucula]
MSQEHDADVRSIEKEDPEIEVAPQDSTFAGEEFDDEPEDVRVLPRMIRAICSMEDDPSTPTITFRYFLLCLLFVPPGAFMSQLSQYRTVFAPYPVLFVQVASHYLGHVLARVLPEKTIRVPFTSFGFNLNPGPWSIKENVLVTLTATSGATSNAAWASISVAKVYYNTEIPAAACLFFMYGIVFLGYGIAAIARQLLLYDPIYPWPYALMQTALYETLRKTWHDSWVARKQKMIFFGVLGVTIVWEFLPQYIFPFLSSLSFLCWIAPRNPVANFLGAGIGGLGFLNFSLDWNNIANPAIGNPMVAPFWTTAIATVAFVINCWILLPIAKWGNLGRFKTGLMSNRIFMANGKQYPAPKLVTLNYTFNQTAYEEYGPIFMGTQQLWTLFFDYSTYVSALVWMALFGWPNIRDTIRQLRLRKASHKTISELYPDRLNVIMRSYPEVPIWWFVVLGLGAFVAILSILSQGHFFIPIWTLFVAIFTSGLMMVPFAWLFALSSFQVSVGSFNELLYGYMATSGSGHRHPAGATAYGAIAGNIWYRAQYMLQDQKIGHYMHVPPRAVFFSQIFGALIGIPVDFGVIQWITNTKHDYLLGIVKDPLGQWTGQALASYYSVGVMYVLVGPKRMFEQHIYKPLPFGFLYGALAPVFIYMLHRAFPKSPLKFRLWNVTIFGAAMGIFYGNLTAGFISRFIVGYISMRYFYWKRVETWRRYNYLVAAALDAGLNIAIMLIFIFLGSWKVVPMPFWWGNNEDNIERCFALPNRNA